ncbi:MAG: PQQ-dependent sugar dehydrogenase [Verrucomicrobiae bacterium]|nr:PQQ-dependent sugar dehydrogenase [Verrucomicrobiae bacterium]
MLMPLVGMPMMLSTGILTANAAENETRWTDNRLTGTGGEPLPLRAVVAFPGIETNRAVDLDLVDGKNGERNWLLTELTGGISAFPDDSETKERRTLLTFSDGEKFRNQRLYSIELHPDFPKKAWLFVSLNVRVDGEGFNRIVRFTFSDPDALEIDPDSEIELLSWPSAGHDGCDLKFGPDGMLYASTGDGESPGDPANIGQKTDNLLGSILRLDVSHPEPDRPWRAPDDNPWVTFKNVPDAIWAYGLRNPWRMNFHPETGELFLGDNGDENWELVRRVTRGSNHGWSAYEGSHPFRLTNELAGPNAELTTPIWEHPHTEMRSIIGGCFYRGTRFPELKGRYVYGCYFTRKLWSLAWDDMAKQASDARRLADLDHAVVSFAEDRDGEILVVTHDGPIYRLDRAPTTNPTPIPATLSATGLFSETASLQPAPGVRPYAINAEAWADGAEVVRHFAVAPGDGILARSGENERKSWQMSDGGAFARTIRQKVGDSDAFVRLETQVMHKDHGEWKFLTYRWRADQSDADLVPDSGETQPCQVGDHTLSHRFPGRAECAACHTQRSFFALAFSTEQLQREEQIADFVAAGLFRKGQEPRPEQFPALTDPHASTASLDARARAYLHVNCAHCHRETGLGGRAQFQLLHWLDLAETGAVNARPLVGLPGIGENGRVIAPGHPELSEIVRRMATRGPNQMPLIGSDEVDKEGLSLVREWISSLPEAQVSAKSPDQK